MFTHDVVRRALVNGETLSQVGTTCGRELCIDHIDRTGTVRVQRFTFDIIDSTVVLIQPVDAEELITTIQATEWVNAAELDDLVQVGFSPALIEDNGVLLLFAVIVDTH